MSKGKRGKVGRPKKTRSAAVAAMNARQKGDKRKRKGYLPGSIWRNNVTATRSDAKTADDDDDINAGTTVDANTDALRQQYRDVKRSFAKLEEKAQLNADAVGFARLQRRYFNAREKMQEGRAMHFNTRRKLLIDVSCSLQVSLRNVFIAASRFGSRSVGLRFHCAHPCQ